MVVSIIAFSLELNLDIFRCTPGQQGLLNIQVRPVTKLQQRESVLISNGFGKVSFVLAIFKKTDSFLKTLESRGSLISHIKHQTTSAAFATPSFMKASCKYKKYISQAMST